MNHHTKFIFFLSLALLPASTLAQEPDPPALEDQALSPPPTLNGQRPSLAFQSEKSPRNYVSGGLSFTDAFTDNMYMSTTDTASSFTYLVQPFVSFARETTRLNFETNFGAGFTFYQHSDQEDQVAKNVGLDLSYRWTQHLTMRVSNVFADTTGLYSASNPALSGSGTGLVQQSNNSIFVPPVQRTVSNSSLAELSYQFSPASVVGIRGTFSILDYPSSSSNTNNSDFGPLYNTQTYSGEAFYNHQISLGEWVGFSLRVQRLDTQPSTAYTDTASMLFFYALQPHSNITLSFFAGPEYYDTPAIAGMPTTGLVVGPHWTTAVGTSFGWQGTNTSATAGFSRQVSDGGGLYSAVTLQEITASLRSQLTERQAINVGFTQSQNQPLGTSESYGGLSVSANLEHLLTRKLVLRIGYARQRQQVPTTQNTASANLAWVSITYNFLHAFGK
jgi:hypothetical protein